VAHAVFDLVAQEDPAAPELVRGEDVPAGVVEDRRCGQVEEGGDLVGIEDFIAGESRSGARCRRVGV